MFYTLKTSLLITITVLLGVSSISATDGYFRHGYGIKYSALAGSGVAVSLSSLGAISNPAGLIFWIATTGMILILLCLALIGNTP